MKYGNLEWTGQKRTIVESGRTCNTHEWKCDCGSHLWKRESILRTQMYQMCAECRSAQVKIDKRTNRKPLVREAMRPQAEPISLEGSSFWLTKSITAMRVQ